MKLTRREMLKLMAASAAAAALPVALPRRRRSRRWRYPARLEGPGDGWDVAHTACIICGQKCPLNVYTRTVAGSTIAARIVYNRDPMYDEFFATCGRPQTIFELQYLEERIRRPMVRVGPRGSGRFREITWDEAISLLASKLKKYMAEPWRVVVAAHQGYEAGFVKKLFKTVYGTPNVTGHCDTCHTGLDHGNIFVLGRFQGPAGFQPDYPNARIVVEMGRNPVGGIVASAWTKRFAIARSEKTSLVVFDVRESRLTQLADEYHIIPPGTDLAITLALLNVILSEGLYNRSYLVKWTNAPMLIYTDTMEPVKLAPNPRVKGKKTYLVYDEATKSFRLKTEAVSPSLEYTGSYNGRPVKTALMVLMDAVKGYTPEWAEKITGVPADAIRSLARRLAAAAPHAFIDHGYRAARYYNEGMLKRTIILVNVLLGSIGSVGGLAYPAGKPKFKNPISIIGFKTTKAKGTPIYKYWEEQGVVELAESKCWSQLLVRTIIEGKPYPIGVLILSRENLLSHAIGGKKLAEALRSGNTVDYIVVMDTVMNESTMYADLVLPVPFYFEYESLVLGYAKKSYVDIVTDAQKALSPPPGIDPRPEWWILVEVFKRLGLLPAGKTVNPIEVKKIQAESVGIDYSKLRERGYALKHTKPKYHPWGGKPLPTVTGELEVINVAFLSKYKSYLGKESPLNPLPTWIRPYWMRRGSLGPDEFVVVEFQDQLTAINTFMRYSRLVKDSLDWKKVYGVQMHPSRAARLGLKTGDMVRLVGPNGSVKARVIVTRRVHPAVLAVPHATAVDTSVIPLTATVQTLGGSTLRIRLFANGGGYGDNNNFLADPLSQVVPEEGGRAAEHDFVVRVEKL